MPDKHTRTESTEMKHGPIWIFANLSVQGRVPDWKTLSQVLDCSRSLRSLMWR